MRRPLALLALPLTCCMPPPEPTIPRRAVEEPLTRGLTTMLQTLANPNR